MQLTVVTASISRAAGGLFTSVRRLTQSLQEIPGLQAQVLANRDPHSEADLPQWGALPVKTFPVRGPAQLGYTPQLKPALLASDADLVHDHGIWMYPSAAVFAWHQRTRRPYLISPRGMLDVWALNNSRWKKRLAGWLFENKHLAHAACLHALCESEAQAIRAFGLRNPICVIPNGMDLPPNGVPSSEFRVPSWRGEGRKVLLYLGRLHPKKGLVNLIKAWHTAKGQRSALRGQRAEEWVLAIAGWDQGGHEAELKQLATELGLVWADSSKFKVQSSTCDEGLPNSELAPCSVLFLGPQFGPEKAACFQQCDAFILPSFSEGLPMTVLEAWSYGKPVLMTPGCNLPEGFAAEAAWRVETSVQSLAESLGALFSASDSALAGVGQRGKNLVAKQFAWPTIAAQMKAVYDWSLGGGPKPACVLTV